MSTVELDAATKQRLTEEVERLVRMGMEKLQARRIVWEDYLDELATYAATVPTTEPEPPQPEPSPPETPVPEPPKAVPPPVAKPMQAAPKEPFFTPERLQRNRAELAKVKRLVGLRS